MTSKITFLAMAVYLLANSSHGAVVTDFRMSLREREGAECTGNSYTTKDKSGARTQCPASAGIFRSVRWIFDANNQTVTMIHDDQKTYSVMTAETVRQMAKSVEQMGEMAKQMQAHMDKLKALPPEQRKMLEKMMGKPVDSPPRRQVKGGQSRVGAWRCELVETREGAAKTQERCLATWKEVGLDIAPYRPLIRKYKEMMAPMSKMAEKFGTPLPFEEDAVTLRSTQYSPTEKGKILSETLITRIGPGEVPASAFEIPAGYKRTEMPQMKVPAVKKAK